MFYYKKCRPCSSHVNGSLIIPNIIMIYQGNFQKGQNTFKQSIRLIEIHHQRKKGLLSYQ
uniref:Uncharacterized protein n=1 Tax=Anguilla anguilla TaxID=7936 RepID=A0A0E9T4G0_ANGAN